MTPINTRDTREFTVQQQAVVQEPFIVKEVSKSYDDAIGQFIAKQLDHKERIPAVPPELQKRLEGWREFLSQFLLDPNGSAKSKNGDYMDKDGQFRDKNDNLIDVDGWINNWLLQKRVSTTSV